MKNPHKDKINSQSNCIILMLSVNVMDNTNIHSIILGDFNGEVMEKRMTGFMHTHHMENLQKKHGLKTTDLYHNIPLYH